MTKADEKTKKDLAKALTVKCVRNTFLEDIHAGKCPMTKTGDYSDVRVIDAEGREFTWAEASHISNIEMKKLMKEVVNNLYEYLVRKDKDPDSYFQELALLLMNYAHHWDDPEYPVN